MIKMENYKNMSSAGLIDYFAQVCFEFGIAWEKGESTDDFMPFIKEMEDEILKRFVR